ncbi:hypothetical protein [Providencia rettgeri]|uniref:hypothetical protein n=1 Tax=Providencia rettgeri TaxID=587 RepID=UPI00308037AF
MHAVAIWYSLPLKVTVVDGDSVPPVKIHDEAVYLKSQILKVNNDKEEPVSVEKGFWLKAEDSQGRPDDIMASVKMTFEDCNFITEGVYCIRVSILKDNKITNSNQAYFKVSQVYDKPKS